MTVVWALLVALAVIYGLLAVALCKAAARADRQIARCGREPSAPTRRESLPRRAGEATYELTEPSRPRSTVKIVEGRRVYEVRG